MYWRGGELLTIHYCYALPLEAVGQTFPGSSHSIRREKIVEPSQTLAVRLRFGISVVLDKREQQRRLSHRFAIDLRMGLDDSPPLIFTHELKSDVKLIPRDHVVPKRDPEDLFQFRATSEIVAAGDKKLGRLIEAFQDKGTGHNRRSGEVIRKIIFALTHVLHKRALLARFNTYNAIH